MGYGINSNLTKLITEINRGAKPDAVIIRNGIRGIILKSELIRRC